MAILHPHGYLIITEDGVTSAEHDTLLCPHCQGIIVIQPGSGKRRDYCLKCKAVTCGKKECRACLTFEQKQDRQRVAKMNHIHFLTESGLYVAS